MVISCHFYNMEVLTKNDLDTNQRKKKKEKRSNRLHQTNALLFSFGSAAETRL